MNEAKAQISLWEQDIQFADCELVIVGGGLTGLTTAIHYIQERKTGGRVLILDKEPFIRRGSTRNAGFAVFGSISELLDDIGQMDFERAMHLARWRAGSLGELLAAFPPEVIDYRSTGGMELFLEDQKDLYRKAVEILDQVNDRLSDLFPKRVFRMVESPESLPFQNIYAAIDNPFEGLLHPGKLVRALEQRSLELGVETRCGIQVDEIERINGAYKLVFEDARTIQSERVLIATNGLAGRFLPLRDIHPARNVILITEPLPFPLSPKAYHVDRGYLYFRPVEGRRMLIGGGRHWVQGGDRTASLETERATVEALSEFAKNILGLDELQIEMSWAGTMGVGAERMPVLERIDEGLVACVRLGGMGLALSASLGKKAAELLLDKS